jgi:hypothetical protein
MMNELIADKGFMKFIALAAAAVVFAWPQIKLVASRGLALLPKKAPSERSDQGLSDMRTVLELASRMKERGLAEGVDLCQQLIDVMLTSGEKKK